MMSRPGRNPSETLKPEPSIEEKRAISLIATYLRPVGIRLDLASPNKHTLFDAIGRHMEQAHALPNESVSQGLARRELLSSTGLGLGFAIPHCRGQKPGPDTGRLPAPEDADPVRRPG